MKKYIEVNNSDELILIDNKTKRAKYSVIYYDNDIIMKNIKEKYKNFFSIKEIDINTLACISSLDNFIINSERQKIPQDMITNINNLRDFMYNKINDKKIIDYDKIIDTKYYRVSFYKE